jgi:GH25 family lysozyme M1 (1,4-beta-N-acetylmuramidase)
MITLLDCWEGQLEIDEAVILENGVKGLMIRLNDMNGGHHMDENFVNQWSQASGFLRAPYFVYNPWVSGQANADWMFDHLPADVPPRVLCDVEVRYPDYPAEKYAEQVQDFIDIIKGDNFRPCIYTGAWFLPYLAYWPKDVDYWWARYPTFLYPPEETHITWQEFHDRLEYVGWYPDPLHLCPGPVKLWQCSADRYILPGVVRIVDVNAWNGSLTDLEAWWGESFPLVVPDDIAPQGIMLEVLTEGLRVRTGPNTLSSVVGSLEEGEIIEADDIGGTSAWAHITSGRYAGRWAAVQYGTSKFMRVK